MQSWAIKQKMAAAVVLLAALGLTSSVALAGQLDGFAPVDLSNWKPRTAASAMALVEPLYRGHPEGMEGRPKLKIELRKEANVVIIDVEQTGFLDDSLRGEKHRAIVVRSPKGWHLKRLGKKRSCYRGGSKAWRTGRCL